MPGRRLRFVGPALALLLVPPLACTDDDGSAPTSGTAATSTTPTTEPTRPDDNVLTVGLLLPMSGEGSSIGQGMADAATRAVNEINRAGGDLGKKVRLVRD